MQPVDLIIIGAGSRGDTYAGYAGLYPEQARVVGVAEPREFYRRGMAEKYTVPAQNVAERWEDLAGRDKFADAVVIATPDRLHAAPAIAFANKGYAILLEKPMAPNAGDCRKIVEAARKNHTIFAVCHVMRYTAYTQKLKQLLDSGLIGEIVSVQHLEPVGYWHQAHSFVRGNWRNEAESSFMLLSKSCHDIDWLRYVIGEKCVQVSSFGSLAHFKRSQKPAGAGDAKRCLDCAYEERCPYSAKRFYLTAFERGHFGWPLDVITHDLTRAGALQALRDGPYGRCVYECDNDVVDHQVVNLLYANGATASFSMMAFTEQSDRKTAVFGTLGELRGDGEKITHFDFLTNQTQVINAADEGSEASGHGGGDYGLMSSFVKAVAAHDPAGILSGAEESLETHLTVFAAEESRRKGQTLDVTL